MSVQDILATHDCSVAGCPGEAYERGGLCRYHQTTSARPRPVAPGSHAHLMEERPPLNTCKQPGCTNPTAGKGGWCVGLCDEHISIEGTRRQAVRRERLQAEKPESAAVKPPPVGGQPKRTAAPPVAAKPPAQAAPERPTDGQPTLVQLAQTVEDAAHEIEYARNRHQNAIHALRQALEAA